MQALDTIKRTIDRVEDLQALVKTMKSLAAVNIRQYEQAVTALTAYHHTIALGLQALLRSAPFFPEAPTADWPLGMIVFGSDQGLCGRFSEQSVSTALALCETPGAQHVVAVGTRAATRLEEAAQVVETVYQVPASLAGVLPLVQDLSVHIDTWQTRHRLQRLLLVYNHFLGGAAYQPVVVSLLPVDLKHFQPPRMPPWPTRSLPMSPTACQPLRAALLRQHFFVALHRAVTESLASENASRLAAMQAAESNIATRLDELQTLFRYQRQQAITEELLDIVAGYEALAVPRKAALVI